MSDLDRLTLTYAREFPEEFATAASAAPRVELLELLQKLPADVAIGVVARLSVSAFRDVCTELKNPLSNWLNSAKFDDSVALLTRLPRREQIALVAAVVDRATRRRLRQFLNFPAHSVGSLAVELPLRIAEQTPLAELLQELRELDDRNETPVVVTGSQGQYVGVLDVWRLALVVGEHGRVRDVCRWVNPVLPEVSLASARELVQWNRFDWLPVVDHEQRILGFVRHQQVFGIREMESSEAEIIGDSLVVLGSRYFTVLGRLLERMLGSVERLR
jgi:Mg/Co/Ni transporter MgtE